MLCRYRMTPSFVARYFRLLLILTTCTGTLFFLIRHVRRPRLSLSPSGEDGWDEGDTAGQPCQMPVLHLDTPELRQFFTDPAPLTCDAEQGWVEVVGGSRVVVRDSSRKAHGGKIECQFTDLLRENDYKTVEGFVTSSETEYVLRASDYVRVSCTAADGATWRSLVSGARQSAAPSSLPLSQLPDHHARLNILFIGIDSLSHNTFKRKLPMTADFIKETLGAVEMKGYNIVGDGTPQALIPILTGQTEEELPETRRSVWGADFVNVYPFIWKDLQKDGYVTAYLEDCPKIGTFQYRLNGFERPPTTHYMRTFWLSVDDEMSSHPKYCLRDVPRHKVQLDNIESIWDAYPDRSKFVFSFQGELSHDDINKVAVADSDLLAMLSRMWRSGRLNNTALVVMADHGHRFAAFRNTLQGKLEERLPYVAWRLPETFRRRFPEAVEALKQHANQLTTPFDQYFTLQHLRHMTGDPPVDPAGRGRSWLAPGDPRSCAETAVLPHWCACVNRRPLSLDHPIVAAAADAFQRYVNTLQEAEAAGLCEKLVVGSVISAEQLQHERAVRAFVKSSDQDGREADLSGDARASVQTVQLRLAARPGWRLFEVTMSRTLPDGRFQVRHPDISRTDRYGSQARCVMHRMDHMRKLCFCKEAATGTTKRAANKG